MKPRGRQTRFVSILTVQAPRPAAMIDMMRYDRCCPFLPRDAEGIGFPIRRGDGRRPQVIQLIRFASNNAPPESGRWRSFLCCVLDERGPDAVQLPATELADLADRPTLIERVNPTRQRQSRFVSSVCVRTRGGGTLIEAMRRECCCPATEAESGKIERLLGGHGEPSDHLIRLTRFAAADDPPDAAGWRILGVDLLDERGLDVASPSDADLAHLARLPAGVLGAGGPR